MSNNIFLHDFATQSVHDWEKVAQHELGNKDPWQNLTKEKAGVVIKPYYDSLDRLLGGDVSSKQRRGTDVARNVPKIVVTDEKTANEVALSHLLAGADGIYFELSSPVKPHALLRGIELGICSLFFRIGDGSEPFVGAFNDYVVEKSEQEKITGAFFRASNSLGENESQVVRFKNRFKSNGLLVPANENIVDEIVDALCAAVEFIEQHRKTQDNVDAIIHTTAFSVSIGTDFFLNIAKVRALQKLWFTLQQAYQIKEPSPLFIHADSTVWNKESFQPHGNLLKQTTGAMAAFMAGCDAITVEPEEKDSAMMVRIARNALAILKEESHLEKVEDPLAGSYFVDCLTEQIAAAAWKKFQEKA
jgi:methylmalonyl-CoA mutase